MSRTTIDFGIDLGTTNSAIAVLKGVVPEIIKNNADADITPSAVSIDKRGIIQVGQRAKNRVIEFPEDAYIEFKRRMGSDQNYRFKSSGQTRKPEELSAEVLKSLATDVTQRTGEQVEAAVITVPAAFELHQCDATRKAAQLAGFKESPLLQEPVAAALAYGFQANMEKAYWLIYDFGGGTFDAAILKAEDGGINVVNHGGDNFLGGSDIDWAIVEQLLAPKLVAQYSLENFTRGNVRWRQMFTKLKRAAEIAKIDLSRVESTVIDACRFTLGQGEDAEFECDLTRAEVIRVAEPIILRSVEICKRVLIEKKLGEDAVARVILVGGPTLAPYFRELLAAHLNMPLDYSVDPLTVVAKGAAIFAGTQRRNAGVKSVAITGEFAIDLKYKPVGLDQAPIIGGKVTASKETDFTNFTLELVNPKTQWRSGKISLRPDGVFVADLHAEKGERNTFAIELSNPAGLRQKVKPDELCYTIGVVVEEQPLINSMGISLRTNGYEKLFEKGRGLPLKTSRSFRTVEPLKQKTESAIRIPVVEGEHDLADRNRLVGCLEIRGTDIHRDLPAGTEVEVTLRLDESRILTVNAFIALLDEEFEARLDLRRYGPSWDDLMRDFDVEMSRFGQLVEKVSATPNERYQKLLQEIDESPLLREVRENLASAQCDPDAGGKCEKRLLEFKLKLDEVSNALEWPSLVATAREWVAHIKKVAEHGKHPQGLRRAAEFAAEVDDLISQEQLSSLRKKNEEASRVYYEITASQPEWWIYQLGQMESQSKNMRDPDLARVLIEQGRDCASKNNIPGLRNIITQLWEILPPEISRNPRGYQSGLVR